ncbi:hypothetical protein E2562_003587 [Oryza meyeriana var. granulata]|uniref:F-box domain-containing protein n=1 Tax=Oryza meyeriana var. granulata TaxID=110450 RepID=A0A6G1CN90_9ORYZ|nr:hypothetical protein E2562_003587 [Oryza meyeriana var. granulata]
MARARAEKSARTKRRRIEPADIPEEIVEQILLRLPVKSILRFRSVCRSWHAMVADPRFVRLQLHHSTAARRRPPSMLVLQHWRKPQEWKGTIGFFRYPGHGTTAEFAHERAWSSLVDTDLDLPLKSLHCNGLVLVCSAGSSSEIFVCNPATKELAVLPAGTADYIGAQTVGFGADQSTGNIKVVRCFIRHYNETWTDYSVGCEIFSLGSRAWRPVADSPYFVGSTTSQCILGAIYWIAVLPTPPTGSCTTPGMLRFDVRNEEFADFPCPPCLRLEDDVSNTLTELAGKLCCAHVLAGETTVQLWTASAADDGGGGGPRWSLHCTVVLCHGQPARSVSPFAGDYQGGIFFNVDLNVIYRYDSERQVVERVVDMHKEMTYLRSRGKLYHRLSRGGQWMHHVIQYRESLVSIKAN